MRSHQEDVSSWIETRAEESDNPGYAIAFAILRLAEAQEHCATWLKYLGNGDAAGTMGAIEGHAVHIGERLERLADAIDRLSERDES